MRKSLKAKKLKSGKALCRFIRRVGGDSFFRGYSVHLSQPPVFKLAVKTEIKSESALKKLSEMKEFEELLTVFYKEAGIHLLWLKHKAEYEKEIEIFKRVMKEKKPIKRLESFLKEKHPYKEFIVIVDLMELVSRGMVVTQNKKIIVLTGPRSMISDLHGNLIHEALHPFMKPLFEKYKSLGVRREWRLKEIPKDTQASKYYSSWRSCMEETIVRTMVAHCLYSDKKNINKLIKFHSEKQGFIHAPLISEAIEEYKSQKDKNFREFFPKILKKLM